MAEPLSSGAADGIPLAPPGGEALESLIARFPRQAFRAAEVLSETELPLYASRVPAGFPSPADDYLEASLNLNDYLIRHPESTFFVRVSGESMSGAGIFDGDMLVVDRLLRPRHRDVVIAVVAGELTVKRLELRADGPWLVPDHPDYPALRANPEAGFDVWGVVTAVVRSLKPPHKA
ncbi:peptidase S24 and S26 domain protein [Pseudogulbenkiania sp. NH8B]|uniref:LexA family protein n=1 Tax=Pseudogulbenkiania sp. (strain NH8B) TaxID=748280 RepID=UPI000227999F|nr:translesion error-prone DNA polymerase V autoproteolytic subunit [Pseudogulbenkiania sp. NH8B]BAK76280.1 peptidase S24 and S26 domain protein [Pseudogulbenkiania sp. NH8B]